MNQKDTSRDARKVLVGIYRQMPIHVKVMRIFSAYRMGRKLSIAGLRQSYSDATERQIWHLWAKRHLGEKLFEEVYGAIADE